MIPSRVCHTEYFRRFKLHLIIPAVLLLAALLISSWHILFFISIILYLTLFFRAKNERPHLLKKTLIVWAFIFLGALPLLFNKISGESTLHYFRLGTWVIDTPGVNSFRLIVLRCIDAVGAMMLLMQLTPVYNLCTELRQMHTPRLFIDLLELTYRYIYVLQDTTRHIATAQVSRLGYRGYKEKVKDMGLLLAQTLVLTQHEADHLYNGLVSRGYEDDPADSIKQKTETDEEQVIVRLEQISFAYEKNKEILKNINISLKKGERIALLGENGAGKSTLFLLLNGILKHEKGRFFLRDKEIDNSRDGLRAIRQTISLVFQNSNHQLFTPSVYDEIAYGLKNIGYKGEELKKRTEAIIEDFELQDIKYFPPHKLSEGQKKWVAIAAVLAIDPQIIILDEPTSNLDRYYTGKVLNLFDRLQNEGKSILISTHDMNLAYEWAKRVLVMHEGQIIADNSTENVFRDTGLLSQANLESPLLFSKVFLEKKRLKIQTEDFHLPVFIGATGMPCLIVGGGKGAYRKVQTLYQHKAVCTIVSPELCDELKVMRDNGVITHIERKFMAGDTNGFDLIVAATDNIAVNEQVCKEAETHGSLVNSPGNPLRGNFQFAAGFRQEGIGIAIHTDYKLPEIAQILKKRLTSFIPEGLERQLQVLTGLRTKLKTDKLTGEERSELTEEYNNIKNKIEESLKL